MKPFLVLFSGLITAMPLLGASVSGRVACEKKITELKSVLSKDSENKTAWVELRTCANELKNWNDAVEIAMIAKSKNQKNPDPRVILGLAQMYGKDYDRAIEHFDQAIELDSKQPFAYFQIGMAYLFKNETDKAIIAAERAVEMDPDNSVYQRQAAYAYLLLDQLDLAEASAKKAIQIDPEDVAAQKILSKVYAKQGKSIEAAQASDAARAATARKIAASPEPPPPPSDAAASGVDKKEEKLDDADIIAAILNSWDSMKAAIAAGDIDQALRYFSTYLDTRDQYRRSFENIGLARTQRAFSSVQDLYDCEVTFRAASCKAFVKNARGGMRPTVVRFERNPDKIWRIRSF